MVVRMIFLKTIVIVFMANLTPLKWECLGKYLENVGFKQTNLIVYSKRYDRRRVSGHYINIFVWRRMTYSNELDLFSGSKTLKTIWSLFPAALLILKHAHYLLLFSPRFTLILQTCDTF